MKRLLALLFALTAISSLFAEGFNVSNILFGMKTLPIENGGGLDGYLGYKFSDSFSSEVLFRNEISAETSEPEYYSTGGTLITSKALNLERNSITELFIMPLEYTIKTGALGNLSLSAGAYISKSSNRIVGFLKFIPTVNSGATNSYDAETNATFYGPALIAMDDLTLGMLSFSPRVLFVPYFWFTESRTLSIDPMYASYGTGSLNYGSTGTPYFAVSLDKISISLNKILPVKGLSIGADLKYEYQKYDIRFLQDTTAGAATSTWGDVHETNTTKTFSYMGAISFTFDNDSSIRFGFGQKVQNMSEYYPDTGETANSKLASPIYSISYDLKK